MPSTCTVVIPNNSLNNVWIFQKGLPQVPPQFLSIRAPAMILWAVFGMAKMVCRSLHPPMDKKFHYLQPYCNF